MIEYGQHVADVMEVMSDRLKLILESGGRGAQFPDWDQDAAATEKEYWQANSHVTAILVKERAALDEARKQLDAERERLNAERAQFAEAAAAAAAAKRLEDAGKIVDAAVGAGQILPTFRSQLVAFVAHLDDGDGHRPAIPGEPAVRGR